MIAILTRRFILLSLVLVLIAGVMTFAAGRQDAPGRSWVAGQSIPCANSENDACTAPRNH